MTDVADAETANKLAGLQIDLLQKHRSGNLPLGHLEQFLNLSKEQREELLSAHSGLLAPVATYRADGAENFDASERFRKGETDGVKIAWLGSNFKEHFLEKIETGIKPAELAAHDLQENARDPEIISSLVGREVSEGDELQAAAAQAGYTLTHMWELLKAQGDGNDDGPLLTNGYANIFYIRDTDGTWWAVYVRWASLDGGWCVDAYSLGRPGAWGAGRRLVSRDS